VALPNNNLTMRAIFNEINGTSHANGTAITDYKMSEFRADSIAYTDGTYTGGTPNVQQAPDRMSEWFGYTHTQDFDSPTYYVRTGTSTSDYCNYQTATAGLANESHANSATIYYVILNTADSNNHMLEFYMVPDHNASLMLAQGGTEYAWWYNTSSTLQYWTARGNFTNGFTPLKIAELNVGPSGEVGSLECQINTAVISGTGYYLTSYTGYSVVNSGAWFTPSSTKRARIPWSRALAACYGTDTQYPYHSVSFGVRGTGYATRTVGTFVNRFITSATSNNCL